MKKFVKILLVIALVLVLVNGAFLGYMWYQNTHFFVDGTPYALYAKSLDLREKDISFEHYGAVRAQLPDCAIVWRVPFQNGTVDSDTEILTVESLTEVDIGVLNAYLPQLKQVDAGSCKDYPALESLCSQRPDLLVNYTVSLGGTEVLPQETELVLTEGSYDYDLLMTNLAHLPKLTTVQLKKTALSQAEMLALEEQYPRIAWIPTVEILGQEYDLHTTQLNLSHLTEAQIPEVSQKLSLLTELTDVELMDEAGNCGLSKEAVSQLVSQSSAAFHYVFDFYGETVSSDMTEFVLKNKQIGDSGEAEIRLALSLMSGCKRFVLDNCGVSNEIMARLREEFRDRTKLVWRVKFGHGSTLTDAEVIRSVYDLVDDNSDGLNYCEDVVYMDIGHDEFLDYVDFIAHMPNLEVCIVSGSPIKNLDAFANCKKLRVLELSDCGYIADLSALAGCESLEMINLSYTKVKDLSPLDDLPLTHLVAKWHYKQLIPSEEQERFLAQHPDCWAQFDKDDMPYGVGWRYVEKNVKMDWYAEAAKMFRYPTPPNNAGWYMEG